MNPSVQYASEQVERKSAECSGKIRLGQLLDQTVTLMSVLDQRGNRDQFQIPFFLQFPKVGQAGHASVRLKNFTNDSAWMQTGQRSQIDGCLGMTSPFKNSSGTSSQRKHVARLNEFLGTAGRVGQNSNRARAVVRAMPVVMPSAASTETVKSVL